MERYEVGLKISKPDIDKAAHDIVDDILKIVNDDIEKYMHQEIDRRLRDNVRDAINDMIKTELDYVVKDNYNRQKEIKEMIDKVFIDKMREEIRHLVNSRINFPTPNGDLLHQDSFKYGWRMALWCEDVRKNGGSLSKDDLENDVFDRIAMALCKRIKMSKGNWQKLEDTIKNAMIEMTED